MIRNKKSHVLFASFKRLNKSSYPIAAVGILAIIISHFLFQFFFIQNENIQVAEELVQTEQFEIGNQPVKEIKLPEVIEAKAENVEEDSASEAKVKTNKERYIRAVDRKSLKTSKVRTKRSKQKSKRTILKRKVPKKETTAQRLRRAERILTGAE